MTENSPPKPDATDDPVASRESIRRDMLRTSTAVGVVLFIVLVLALVVVLSGARATRNLRRAELAEADSIERLWRSYVAQARAVRLTAEAGRRQLALTAVSNAAGIRTTTDLRTEAVASMALTDLIREGASLPVPRSAEPAEMDMALERFAYGDAQGNVFVSRLSDGERLISLEARDLGPGTRMAVRSTGFSPDGKKLAVRFAGGAIVVWNLETRQRIVATGVDATNVVIAGMSFFQDSDRVAFSDADENRQVSVYNTATGNRIANAVRTGARTFRFRPGAMQLALATDNKVDLIDYPAETVLQTLTHATRVYMHAWSPDGTRLAVSCEDGDVYLWEVDRNAHRLLRGHSEPCVRLGFSPDGKLLFSGSRDGTTRLWDAALGQTIVIANDGVAHIFSEDGKRLGFWKLGVSFGAWRVERSDSYSLLACPKGDGAFLSLDLSPSGRWCLAAQSKGFRVWDLEAGEKETFFPVPDLSSVRMSADEKTIYICSPRGLEVRTLASIAPGGSIRFTDTNTIPLPDSIGARNVALSEDAQTAAVELSDLRCVILDLSGKREPLILKDRWRSPNSKGPGSTTGAGRYALSPDGKMLATGFWFGGRDVPQVWDTRTGELVATLRADTSLVTFSRDGKWLGVAGVGEFAVWSVGNWERKARIIRDETSYTHGALAFAGESGQLAVSRTRQIVQLRDTFAENKYLDFIAPMPQSVNSLRVSRDGSVLVTASATEMIQVWRIGKVRRHLSAMKLDWGGAQTAIAKGTPTGQSAWFGANVTLLVGLVGFGVVTVLSLLTLQRHRTAIERFLTAEKRAAERNRELELAKVELMHSHKMQALGTLAAGIAHDFNNLLSVIRMSNKLIGRETKSNTGIQEHVGDIEQAVLQGKHVVGSMLGYARADDDFNQKTDLSAVVEDAVSLLSKEFLSGITLTLELNRNAPRVNVGRGRIEQVLLNLIVNASEAMQGQGKLKISLHARALAPDKAYVLRPATAKEYIKLSVIDSGPGIAPEVRARLFEPFFTTKRTGAKAGTGLGLSLVYSVAEQDGFGLSVESEPGKGAEFTLVIPVEPTAAPVREKHSSQTNASP
jgi:signal transduction histidine kinase